MRKLLSLIFSIFLVTPAWAVNYCQDGSIGGGWLLNESSGNAADCSSNAFTATASNITAYSQTGKFGTAYLFTSSPESSLNPGQHAALRPASLPITFVAWVKGTNSGEQVIESTEGYFNGACGHSGAWMNMNSGKLVCGFGDNSGGVQIDTSTTSINTGSYVHVACVISGASSMVMYINGVADSNTYSGSGGGMVNRGSSDHFDIGDSICGSRTFQGTMDEPAVFTRTLSSGEISDIMTYGLVGPIIHTNTVNIGNVPSCNLQ